jgi:hypothetical protein
MVAKELTVREAAVPLKVGKTALYEALRGTRRLQPSIARVRHLSIKSRRHIMFKMTPAAAPGLHNITSFMLLETGAEW